MVLARFLPQDERFFDYFRKAVGNAGLVVLTRIDPVTEQGLPVQVADTGGEGESGPGDRGMHGAVTVTVVRWLRTTLAGLAMPEPVGGMLEL